MTMLINSERKVPEVNILKGVFPLVLPCPPKPRTHNFTHQVESVDYVFEAIDDDRAQVTGYGAGLKGGDYIILSKDKICYRVEEIDCYANPRNLWTALLSRV